MTRNDGNSRRSIGRRKFLRAAVGAGATGFLAGCLGGDGGGGTVVRTVVRTVEGEERTVVRTQIVERTPEESFPSEPLLFIVPYSTGGGYNYYTRLVAKYINQEGYLPETVRVQNVTGGGGIVGHNRLANADQDGYTNGIVNTDSMAIAQLTRDEVRFDLRDLTYYPRIAGPNTAIAVGPHVDVDSAQGFVDAMANEELTVGHSGVTSTGTFTYLGVGLATGAYGADEVLNNDVQFPGKAEWITAIKRGDVDVMGASYDSLLPFVESGDLEVVLVMSKESEAPEATPDADTLNDLDISESDADQAIGIAGGTYHRVFAGPPDIPTARAKTVREAIRKAIQNPDLVAEAEENGRPIQFLNSEDTARGVKATLDGWEENMDLLNRLLEEA